MNEASRFKITYITGTHALDTTPLKYNQSGCEKYLRHNVTIRILRILRTLYDSCFVSSVQLDLRRYRGG